MSLSPFNCPHCRLPFQVDVSLALLQVACPHCSQPVTLMNEPPVVEPPVDASKVLVSPTTEPPVEASSTTGARGYSPADLLPPVAGVSPDETIPPRRQDYEAITDDYRTRQFLAEEQATRRFIKNSIVWVGCTIVLALILAYFLRQGVP